jgi:hypothetical protein
VSDIGDESGASPGSGDPSGGWTFDRAPEPVTVAIEAHPDGGVAPSSSVRRWRSRRTMVALVSAIALVLCAGALVVTLVARGNLRLPFVPRAYTAADVDAAVLSTSDLPDYSLNDVNSRGLLTAATGATLCDRPDLKGVLDGAHASNLLGAASPWSPVLSEAVLTSQPKTAMPAIRREFDCGTWTTPDGEKLTLQQLHIPSYGDESYAALIQGSSADPIYVFIAIRKRNLVSLATIQGFPPQMWSFINLDLTRVAAGEAVDISSKAAARLPTD